MLLAAPPTLEPPGQRLLLRERLWAGKFPGRRLWDQGSLEGLSSKEELCWVTGCFLMAPSLQVCLQPAAAYISLLASLGLVALGSRQTGWRQLHSQQLPKASSAPFYSQYL